MVQDLNELRTQLLVEFWGQVNAQINQIILSGVAAIFDRVDVLDELVKDEIDLSTESILGGVGDMLGDFESGIQGSINTNINQSFDLFDGAVAGVTDTLGGLIGGAQDVIVGAGQSVTGAVTGLIDRVERALEAMINKISNVVSSALQTVLNTIGNAVDTMIRAVRDAIGNAIDAIQDLGDAIFQKLAEIVSNIRDTLVDAFNNVTDFIGGLIEDATAVLQSVGDTIGDFAEAAIEQGREVLQTIQDGIDSAIDGLFNAADAAIGAVRDTLDNLQNAVMTAIDATGRFLDESVKQPLLDIADEAFGKVGGIFSGIVEGADEHWENIIQRFFEAAGMPPKAADTFNRVLSRTFPANPIMQFLVMIVVVLQMTQAVANVPVGMISERFGQDLAKDFPIALLRDDALRELVVRSQMSEDEAIDVLQRSGFSQIDAARSMALKRRLPDIGVIQVWFLREFITRDQATFLLRSLGLEDDDAERMLEMAFFIPPVQDLITMAVREVFSPEVAERFGQFEDFPEDFEQFAAQQGISPEWAQRYWAAHWALPSVQMGFEMLHRRVINEQDLDLLLRAQDVMPFWRERLKQISFRPLTRVDVRRMHDLGILDNEATKDAYKDLGYNEENAQRMLDFTIAFNADPPNETPEELEALTRAAVLGLFSDGALTEVQTLALLLELGIGQAAAAIFIEAAKIDQERSDRKEQTAVILEQATAGLLSFSQAQDRLGQIGLEPLELSRALTSLERKQAQATRLPSRADLDKMLAAGLITDAEYLQTLEAIGYAPFWSERFLSLQKGNA